MLFDRFVLFKRRVRGSQIFARLVRLGDDFYAPQFVLFSRRRRLEFLHAIREQVVQTLQELVHGFRSGRRVHQRVWVGRSKRIPPGVCAPAFVGSRGRRRSFFVAVFVVSIRIKLFQSISQNSHGPARVQPSLFAALH